MPLFGYMPLAREETVTQLSGVLTDLETAATVIAIIVGGIWSYLLFVRQRLRYPAANIAHEISTIGITEKHILVNVAASIENKGKVLLRLTSCFTRLQRIRPLDEDFSLIMESRGDLVEDGETEVDWPLLGVRDFCHEGGMIELEPGEKEELVADFVIGRDVRAIVAYTYVKNMTKPGREIGWSRTTIREVDLSGTKGDPPHVTETGKAESTSN